MLDYDLELRRHHAAFRSALHITVTDNVLDIGCGAGETTREAARIASEGNALGIDRSEPMIQRARALALEQGLSNVHYESADVERYAFAQADFDIAISRFGTMFFTDPGAAFENIQRALNAHGRLVMIVWQRREQNEWAVEIQRAVAGGAAAAAYTSASSQAFSLGDPDTVRPLLISTGFNDVTLDEVHEPVFYGSDVESAFAFVSQFLSVQEALKALSARERKRAEDQMRSLLEAHRRDGGIWFDSRAWIVRARRA